MYETRLMTDKEDRHCSREIYNQERRTAIESLKTEVDRILSSKNPTSEEIKTANRFLDRIESLTKEDDSPGPQDGGFDLKAGAGAQTEKGYGARIGYTSHNELFGNRTGNGGFENFGEFARAILNGGGDSRLHWAGGTDSRAMGEDTPSTGGFLVPDEFAGNIIDVAVEESVVMPRAQIWPMQSETLKIPGFEIGDHSNNLYGGVINYWGSEAGSMTETSPKTRNIQLTASKLYALTYSSNELRFDAPNFDRYVSQIIANSLAWYLDRSMLSTGSAGDGSGKPQSVLHAGNPALIVQPKETGQSADSIVYENLTKMVGRLYPNSFRKSVWVIHPTCISPLPNLSIAIGTAGSHVPVMSETNGTFKILSRPVIVTEKAQTLGDQSDVSLIDFSAYAIGLRGSMQLTASPHHRFQTDETSWRGIIRADAVSTWNEVLTLENGSDTVSPFVTLAERA